MASLKTSIPMPTPISTPMAERRPADPDNEKAGSRRRMPAALALRRAAGPPAFGPGTLRHAVPVPEVRGVC
jgi:hypothetical protein